MATTEELMQAVVRGRRKQSQVDMIVDARNFPDHEALQLSRHTGNHPRIISRICKNKHFVEWLREVKHRFQRAYDRKAATDADCREHLFVLATYCRMGKHRSVATAAILSHIFQFNGWQCETEHLSYSRWGKNCCKGKCSECTNTADPELLDALDAALVIWNNLRL